MTVARLHWYAVFLVATINVGSCEGARPASYIEQLQCGMTLEQVGQVSDVRIERVEEHRLGDHRARFGRNAVWLGFVDGRLKTATAQTITGPTSARLSPKRDLCTGELTYFVSVEWIAEFRQPKIYLDGELVAENAASGVVFEMSPGEHVIRLEVPGIVAVEKKLVLGESSFGDQWIDFDESPP